MDEKVVKRVYPVQFALMYGAVSAVIGVIIGLIVTLFSAGIITLIPASTVDVNAPLIGIFIGVGSIIVIPIGLFIVGFIQGLIVAVIYNFLAPRIGGIKVVFE